MAEPLMRPAGPGTIAVLEEAVQLLRQAPFSTLVCHAIGSVPFALGLLVFWNSLTTERMTDAACAIQALVLALLLLWMNCWRAVFAGHLRRQLDGTPGTPWTWSRAARLATGQAFLGGTKLVILPLAALVGFPLAAATAFFRNATALADRDDLDPLQLISKARALAQVHPRQSWAILPVLAFLQVVVALNLALTFAMLPLLVRMLTGYESDFNRGGIFFPRESAVFGFRAGFHVDGARSVRAGGLLRALFPWRVGGHRRRSAGYPAADPCRAIAGGHAAAGGASRARGRGRVPQGTAAIGAARHAGAGIRLADSASARDRHQRQAMGTTSGR